MNQRQSWESVVREFASKKYVHKRNEFCYEVSMSDRCNNHYVGRFMSEDDARKIAIQTKIEMVRDNIVASGFDPSEVVASSAYPYLAHCSGVIFSVHGRVMRPSTHRCGYLQTVLNGRNCSIHTLIAQTFIPNPNNWPCVNHKDGNKANNDISNLEWCSHSQNTVHSFSTGLQIPLKGEEIRNHKLNADQVQYIRQVCVPGDKVLGATALARRFGVNRTTILDAFYHKTWRHIS